MHLKITDMFGFLQLYKLLLRYVIFSPLTEIQISHIIKMVLLTSAFNGREGRSELKVRV